VVLHFFSEHFVDLEKYGWAYKISNNLGRFMHGFLPPFVTLVLNFVLIDILTMACIEKIIIERISKIG